MPAIKLTGGMERDEVFDKNGEPLGVAVYDLDDSNVRSRTIDMKNDLKALVDKYEALHQELSEDKTLDEYGVNVNISKVAALDVECANEMFAIVDGVFGQDFCITALGDTRNYGMLWELVSVILERYGVKSHDEMKKYVDKGKRQAGTKAGK